MLQMQMGKFKMLFKPKSPYEEEKNNIKVEELINHVGPLQLVHVD